MARSPEKELSAFLARFDPKVARVARGARAKLRRLMPRALQLVYDNYNALAIGFSPTERASDVVLSIAVYPRWVSLFFMQGARLPDAHGVLKGGGNKVRHVVLDDAATLDRPAIRALMKAALASQPKPSATVAKGHTIIKSVSARQRPRRPTRPGAS